jgi:hypothetical protein
MEGSKTLFRSSELPWARESITSKFIENVGTRPQTGSPVLPQNKQIFSRFLFLCCSNISQKELITDTAGI